MDEDFDPESESIEKKPKLQNLSCEYCGRKYKIQTMLDAHIKKHHNNLTDPGADEDGENTKRFKCGFCDLTFKTRRLLTCVSSAMTPTKFLHFSYFFYSKTTVNFNTLGNDFLYEMM